MLYFLKFLSHVDVETRYIVINYVVKPLSCPIDIVLVNYFYSSNFCERVHKAHSYIAT